MIWHPDMRKHDPTKIFASTEKYKARKIRLRSFAVVGEHIKGHLRATVVVVKSRGDVIKISTPVVCRRHAGALWVPKYLVY